jgi:ParB/RepB/Spo0J family partition protein
MDAREFQLITVPLAAIEVGERRRQDDGDISRLAAGIKKVGLLHPLILRRTNGHYELVTGGRRLKALRTLGVAAVPARLYESLTDDEMREIELEENEDRKAFTQAERERTFAKSKRLVDDAKKAEEVLAQTAPKPRGKKGGQPKKPASTRAVAEALGTSRRDVDRAEQHVALAEQYPFMQKWRQSEVLAIHEALVTVPEAEREDAMAVLGRAKVLPADLAATMLRNIQAKKANERAAIYALACSKDPRDWSRALTGAAQMPPMPDPRLDCLDAALDALRRASKPYPDDPLTREFQECIFHLKRLKVKVQEVSYDARRDLKKGTIQ